MSMYQLLAETDDFMVINKSPGISVHKDQEEQGLTMAVTKDSGLAQLYLVHRLDKVTSGLMVLAKNPETAAALSEQFRLRKVEKYYLAISDKKPRRKQGAIVGDMDKARRGAWKLLRTRNNPAVTQFKSVSLGQGLRLFLLKPTTGKTHQIRVALKSEGAPILGDLTYYAQSEQEDRTYLHAYSLAFSLRGSNYQYRCLPEQGLRFDSHCRNVINEHYAEPEQLTWPTLSVPGVENE